MSLENNLKFMENIRRNGKYVLLTHHEMVKKNELDRNRSPIDKEFPDALKWSPINLKIEPFCLSDDDLLASVLESSNNPNEYANIYLFTKRI
jgi:hypothetical protein